MSPPDAFLVRLRRETRGYHDRVERAVNLQQRLSTRSNYVRLLERFYGYYRPLESLMLSEAVRLLGIDIDQRLKAPLLHRDLTALGHSEATIEAVPRCERLPVLSDTGSRWGCLYVLEGATLGGRIVRRRVRERLGLSESCGCAFFSSYGESVGSRWAEFCSALTAYVEAQPEVADRVIAAAIDTFISFEKWSGERGDCERRI